MKKIDVHRYLINKKTAEACTCGYNLSCPLNRVPENVRRVFFQNFPEFAEARKDGKDRHGEDVDEGSAYQYNPEVFDEE